jgi:hypothetical protein
LYLPFSRCLTRYAPYPLTKKVVRYAFSCATSSEHMLGFTVGEPAFINSVAIRECVRSLEIVKRPHDCSGERKQRSSVFLPLVAIRDTGLNHSRGAGSNQPSFLDYHWYRPQSLDPLQHNSSRPILALLQFLHSPNPKRTPSLPPKLTSRFDQQKISCCLALVIN